MSDEQSTASSAADEIAEPVSVSDLSDAQYSSWQKTGDLPVKAKPEAPPASKPVDAEKSAVEKRAESGTARKKPDQERNWRQLETDRDTFKSRAEALEKELAEFRGKAETSPPDEKKAASLAAPSNLPQPPERPKRPKLAEFKDVPEWETAMEKYEDELLQYPAKRQAFDDAKANFEKQQALLNEKQKTINDAWKALTEKGRAIYGDEVWKKAISDSSLPIYQNDPVERFIRDSEPETAAHLFRYFSLKRSDLERIITLSAREQFRELEALETAMKQELGQEKPHAEPPKKEVTAAKRPPAEVGGRATAQEDDAEAALKAGDNDRYRAIMNRREIAKRKGK